MIRSLLKSLRTVSHGLISGLGLLREALSLDARVDGIDRRGRELARDLEAVEIGFEQYKLAYHALAERMLDVAESVDFKRARIEQVERRAGKKPKDPALPANGALPAITAANAVDLIQSGQVTRAQAERALLH